MLIGTLHASLLRSLLTDKGVKKSNIPGPEVIEQAEKLLVIEMKKSEILMNESV